MQTLQDVIDAAVTCPERYGFEAWFVHGQPVCPMTKEVIGEPNDEADYYWEATKALGCPVSGVSDFTQWWDISQRAHYSLDGYGYEYGVKRAAFYAAELRAFGYRLPDLAPKCGRL